MPTWKGMFFARRGRATSFSVLAVVLALCVGFPAAAVTRSADSPDTTSVPPNAAPGSVPPPPKFALPTDFGFKLVSEQEQAKKDLFAATNQIDGAKHDLTVARRADARAQKQLTALREQAAETQARLDQARENLRTAAAEAYMHAGDAQLAAAISSVTNAKSAVDAARSLHMISLYGESERDNLQTFLQLKDDVTRLLVSITDLAHRTATTLDHARTRVTDLENTIVDANRRIAQATEAMKQFELAATSASSPILGPSRLSANQLADYITSQHYKPNITVPILDLAQMYLDEGAATGVRGDVAFAQSILETGGFANPGSSATDNNFAGIGWCDSCAHGFNFPDARTGVRAQLQLLRTYVDPKFPEADYTDPILLPGTLKLGFRGKVQTWWDLWGTWATAALYGQRVYDIYLKIVDFAKTDPALPPTPLPPPATPPPNSSSPGTWAPGTGPGTKH